MRIEEKEPKKKEKQSLFISEKDSRGIFGTEYVLVKKRKSQKKFLEERT